MHASADSTAAMSARAFFALMAVSVFLSVFLSVFRSCDALVAADGALVESRSVRVVNRQPGDRREHAIRNAGVSKPLAMP